MDTNLANILSDLGRWGRAQLDPLAEVLPLQQYVAVVRCTVRGSQSASTVVVVVSSLTDRQAWVVRHLAD